MYKIPFQGFNYIWTLPDGATGNSNSSILSVVFGDNAQSGNIKVKGHSNYGDSQESSISIVVSSVCDPSAIEKILDPQKMFSVYPNPTSNFVTLIVHHEYDISYTIELFKSVGGKLQPNFKTNQGN